MLRSPGMNCLRFVLFYFEDMTLASSKSLCLLFNLFFFFVSRSGEIMFCCEGILGHTVEQRSDCLHCVASFNVVVVVIVLFFKRDHHHY